MPASPPRAPARDLPSTAGPTPQRRPRGRPPQPRPVRSHCRRSRYVRWRRDARGPTDGSLRHCHTTMRRFAARHAAVRQIDGRISGSDRNAIAATAVGTGNRRAGCPVAAGVVATIAAEVATGRDSWRRLWLCRSPASRRSVGGRPGRVHLARAGRPTRRSARPHHPPAPRHEPVGHRRSPSIRHRPCSGCRPARSPGRQPPADRSPAPARTPAGRRPGRRPCD